MTLSSLLRRSLITGLAGTLAFATASMTTAAASTADTGRFAPLDRPGPALSESSTALLKALSCSTSVTKRAGRETVLLVPGTFVDPVTNFNATYRPALEAAGFPTCTVTLPNGTTGDAQAAGERITFAIREIAKRTGRKVDVLGYSQGGLDPRFAFRFFPDTRTLVDDFVALDPTNHGTFDADGACAAMPCQPGVIQQRRNASFIQAVNSGQETFAPIDYTVVFSRTDEVATPNLSNEGTSSLHTGDGRIANIALQSVCPLDLSEHLLVGSVDNTAYQIALDAFEHPGPAQAQRVPATTCASPLLPGVTPAEALAVGERFGAVIGRNVLTQPRVDREPALRRYTLR